MLLISPGCSLEGLMLKLKLWPPDAKSWLIWKDPDGGKEWGQEEKRTTEDEMVGWHHWLDGHGFGWTPGVGDGQGGLPCGGSWGHKELDTSEWLNWTELTVLTLYLIGYALFFDAQEVLQRSACKWSKHSYCSTCVDSVVVNSAVLRISSSQSNAPIPLSGSESEVTQSCLTLCNPIDSSPTDSLVNWIFQAWILEWVAISFSRVSSRPRDRTQVSLIVRNRHLELLRDSRYHWVGFWQYEWECMETDSSQIVE